MSYTALHKPYQFPLPVIELCTIYTSKQRINITTADAYIGLNGAARLMENIALQAIEIVIFADIISHFDLLRIFQQLIPPASKHRSITIFTIIAFYIQ